MAKIKGSVRSSQMISTYGVGAIVAVEDESFIIAGTDRWTVDEPDILEPRLQRELHVSGFARPPSSENGYIPVIRFPEWYYCPTCRRLDKHSVFCGFDENSCRSCVDEPGLVPSRFVAGCERGHLADFPYFRWVHAGGTHTEVKHVLHFEAAGVTASLRDIIIRCSCGELVTMDGAFGPKALAEFGKCSGNRPWLSGEPETCDLVPRTLQRGASNVWFASVKSALSIPPWSDQALKILGRHWKFLKNVDDSSLEGTIRGYLSDRGSSELGGTSIEDIAAAVRQRKLEEGEDQVEEPIRAQEYKALLRGRAEVSAQQEFVCVRAEISPLVASLFGEVRIVSRLREVRALTGFTRLLPPGQGTIPIDEQTAPLSVEHVPWLPAIEVIGEGVFVTLNEDRLREWESQSATMIRSEVIARSHQRRAERIGRSDGRQITPRLLLIHTLAHVLIDQWALDCGYPAASLRERLYVSDDSMGLLIYTATSDSAGSLGGVVSMAGVAKFDNSLREAIARASWCSADPLCLEAGTQGADSLNLAACHACVLLPETSCEESNVFLDRATLVGTLEDPKLGYFHELVR